MKGTVTNHLRDARSRIRRHIIASQVLYIFIQITSIVVMMFCTDDSDNNQ